MFNKQPRPLLDSNIDKVLTLPDSCGAESTFVQGNETSIGSGAFKALQDPTHLLLTGETAPAQKLESG